MKKKVNEQMNTMDEQNMHFEMKRQQRWTEQIFRKGDESRGINRIDIQEKKGNTFRKCI